jgi:Icc-related predicted phosphoesterase
VWANTVPDDADILLTHGPPFEYLDEGKGCRHLLKEIWRARPKLVVYGHIHAGRGEEIVTLDCFQACYEDVLLGVSSDCPISQ